MGFPPDASNRSGIATSGSNASQTIGTAVSVTNRGSAAQDLSLRARDIGLLDTPKLARDLWIGQDIADFKTELPLTVKPHETILLKITN